MTRAVLSIGANLGDRLGHLRGATDGLHEVLVAASPVYETEPWGVTGQPDFLNAVLVVRSARVDEWGWLDRARQLEQRAGRVRETRWGPRTLDVDIVQVDGVVSDDPELTLPHPGAHLRASVLVPWSDVEPDAVLPGHGPIAALLAGLDTTGVRRTGLSLAAAR